MSPHPGLPTVVTVITRNSLTRKTMAALVAVAAVVALAVPATAAPDQWVLPAPTGPHPVGRADLHLVDQDRTDPWVPTGPRELMVSLWYPAAAAHGDLAPYATAEESRLLLELYGITTAPPDALAGVRTHSRVDAPPLPGRSPLVVLSPGLAFPRWTLTSLAEDLASRGYVVAGVDHTYEGAAVTFPDGRVAACVVCKGGTSGTAITASRVSDLSFVLDRLLADPRYGRLVDPDRIEITGHSIGGSAAAATMIADPRVDAGINLDGSFQPALGEDLARPFLMLGAENGTPGVRPDWDRTWTHLTGWRRWLQVPRATHTSFSDAAVLTEWLGLPPAVVPGARVIEINRAYVAAFTDLHLRHRPQPLLACPSPRFPEVLFVGPTA